MAVTGYGLQAVDQKQKGKFDIEASRLWEDDVFESIRAERWLNLDDFEKALAVGRKRFPEPPRKAASPLEKAAPLEEIAPGLKETNPQKVLGSHRHRWLRYLICGLRTAPQNSYANGAFVSGDNNFAGNGGRQIVHLNWSCRDHRSIRSSSPPTKFFEVSNFEHGI